MSANKGGCNVLGEKLCVLSIMEEGNLVESRGSWLVEVHRVFQAVGEDELFCERQSPGLHGMATTKVVIFDVRVEVERNVVALWLFHAVLLGFTLDDSSL